MESFVKPCQWSHFSSNRKLHTSSDEKVRVKLVISMSKLINWWRISWRIISLVFNKMEVKFNWRVLSWSPINIIKDKLQVQFTLKSSITKKFPILNVLNLEVTILASFLRLHLNSTNCHRNIFSTFDVQIACWIRKAHRFLIRICWAHSNLKLLNNYNNHSY